MNNEEAEKKIRPIRSSGEFQGNCTTIGCMGWWSAESHYESLTKVFTEEDVEKGCIEKALYDIPDGFIQKEAIKRPSDKTVEVFYEKEIKRGHCQLIETD